MNTQWISVPERAAIEAMGFENALLERCCCVHTFHPNEQLMKCDNEMEYMYYVLSGTAKACMFSGKKTEIVICRYVSGDIIGAAEHLLNSPAAKTDVTAETELRCVAIPNTPLPGHNAAFLTKLGQTVSDKFVSLRHMYFKSAQLSSEERICVYILSTEHDREFSQRLSDMSESVGVCYRHCLRIMQQLCGEKILSRSGRGYYIENYCALHEKVYRETV